MPKPLFKEDSEAGNNSNLVPGTEEYAFLNQKCTFFTFESKPGINRVQIKNSYRKRFLVAKLPYKLPTICRCKSGEWYVQFKYEYPDKPGKYKPFKVKDGLNRIHDKDEKEAAFQALQNDISYWLEVLNYNPFEQKRDRLKQAHDEITKKATPEDWSMTEAIAQFRKFINKQNYSGRTIQTYNNYLYNIDNYLKEYPDKDIAANKFTEYDLVEFLDVESDELEWGARTYNNYLDFYITFFNRCRRLEKGVNRKIIYDFDVTGIDYKQHNSQRNKAYTPVIANAIKEELKKPGYENLRDYVEWIFLSTMRPSEIRNLKRGDIDEVNRQMRIIGKTGDRIVPISNQLLSLMERRGALKAGFNQYIFGYAGTISFDRLNKDFFPAKYVAIKSKLGLDHNYTLYSWKHTAVIAMIMAGFKDEEIMVLTGHKTIEAFRTYKRDLIVDNGDVMKGSVIEF